MTLPYILADLQGTQLIPLPTGKKYAPPKGWTGAAAGSYDIEDFFQENDYSEFMNLGLALTDEHVAGFDFDLHRNGDTLASVTNSNQLPWTLAVSRQWEPAEDGFTAFYRTSTSTQNLRDVSPVDIIRKGHRYSVISGDVDDLTYFMFWTNGVDFYAISADTFAAAWETLPEAPEWLLERHAKPVRTSAPAEVLVAAVEGNADTCHRLLTVATRGVESITTARTDDRSINQAMMLAQWALSSYVHHSGYEAALHSLLVAYQAACDTTEDHPFSMYEWTTSLEGAYRKKGLEGKIKPRRCSCSSGSTFVAPEAPEGSLEAYYPLILSELARARVYGDEAAELAQDVATRIHVANPPHLSAAYVRSATKSALVDEWRKRESHERMLKAVEREQAVQLRVKKSSEFDAVDTRLTLQKLVSAAELKPAESKAIQATLAGEKLSGAARVALVTAKKRIRAAAQ